MLQHIVRTAQTMNLNRGCDNGRLNLTASPQVIAELLHHIRLSCTSRRILVVYIVAIELIVPELFQLAETGPLQYDGLGAALLRSGYSHRCCVLELLRRGSNS